MRSLLPKKYTLGDYSRDEQLVEHAQGITDEDIPRRRILLEERYGMNGRLNPRSAPEEQVISAFARIHLAALENVALIKEKPIIEALLREGSPQGNEDKEGLAEKIAIQLASCTNGELVLLTAQFGAKALGDYAVIP